MKFVSSEHCIKGKLTEMKFSKSTRREKEHIRLIHLDLCGQMPTATLSGNEYMLKFTDVCSRFTMVSVIKSKYEVVEVCKRLFIINK